MWIKVLYLGLQDVDELDLTKGEGEFLTAESAEELLAPALTPGAKIAKVGSCSLAHGLLPPL